MPLASCAEGARFRYRRDVLLAPHGDERFARILHPAVERKEGSWPITFRIYSGTACSPTSYRRKPARLPALTPIDARRAHHGCAA